MSDEYHSEIFEHKGRKFIARFYYDSDTGYPWDNDDTLSGLVSQWTSRNKGAGERVLVNDRGSKRFFDWSTAMMIAKRDGWDAPPYKTGTKGQRAERAVSATYEMLRGWCNDDWYYCGISVTLADGREEYTHALWGIESDNDKYHEEVMRELADELLRDIGEDDETKARDMEASRPDMYSGITP